MERGLEAGNHLDEKESNVAGADRVKRRTESQECGTMES